MRWIVMLLVLLATSPAVAEEITLLHFGATWCQPCRQMDVNFRDKRVTAVITKHKIKLRHIDIDADKQTAATHKVDAVPTVILLRKHGQKTAVLKRQVGLLGVEALIRFAEPPVEGDSD